jgi:hypothetical protein
MKRSELEKHLGKNVNLEFSDKELNGELVKSEAYKEFGIKTYTILGSFYTFRCSHVVRLKEIS